MRATQRYQCCAPTMQPSSSTQPQQDTQALEVRIAQLEAQLAEERQRVEALTREREALAQERQQLRASFERLRLELELLKRRIFVAKAERVDTLQLELEFAAKLAHLTRLDAQLTAQLAATSGAATGASGPDDKKRAAPKGRRNLAEAKLPEKRVELTDPVLEALVEKGEAQRMGFEESYKLGWQRAGHVRVVVARAKYKVPGQVPEEAQLSTTPPPPEVLARSLAAPSLLAHLAVEKYCDGLPLFRVEDRFGRDGVPLDRGTMSRWLEDMGATLGATVVEAARREALATAFCIATDATGIGVQPARREDNKRQPCRRAHFFVHIADEDSVFYEYAPKETSAAVAAMFFGFSGYVQADAKSVFDILFVNAEDRRKRLTKGAPPGDVPDVDEAVRHEVGCWSHARRKFWEAAVAKDATAREALFRIGRFFDLEEKWKGRPHAEVTRLREEFARPHVDSFFQWASAEYEKVKGQRGLLCSAFGYVTRHQVALRRYLEDGRLALENNRSERALRKVAVGRKAWLFVGSDDHGTSTANLLSLIATARLHGLNPEAYLRDVLRVLPHWPNDRYLELSPKHWAATRARLDSAQLAAELGPLTVPPPEAATTEEQATSR
jgi:transposase